MDRIDEIGLAARIAFLEEMVALLIATIAKQSGKDAEGVRVTLWQMQPQFQDSVTDPERQAFLLSWENRVDALFDRVAQLINQTPTKKP